MSRNKIIIFWDFDNCLVPKTLNEEKSLEKLTRLFGGDRVFTNIYYSHQMPEIKETPYVRVIPCPAKKEAADKRMIVDMIEAASDHRVIEIVLVSSDMDFDYVVDKIKSKRKITVIKKEGADGFYEIIGYKVVKHYKTYNYELILRNYIENGFDPEDDHNLRKPLGMAGKNNDLAWYSARTTFVEAAKAIAKELNITPAKGNSYDMTFLLGSWVSHGVNFTRKGIYSMAKKLAGDRVKIATSVHFCKAFEEYGFLKRTPSSCSIQIIPSYPLMEKVIRGSMQSDNFDLPPNDFKNRVEMDKIKEFKEDPLMIAKTARLFKCCVDSSFGNVVQEAHLKEIEKLKTANLELQGKVDEQVFVINRLKQVVMMLDNDVSELRKGQVNNLNLVSQKLYNLPPAALMFELNLTKPWAPLIENRRPPEVADSIERIIEQPITYHQALMGSLFGLHKDQHSVNNNTTLPVTENLTQELPFSEFKRSENGYYFSKVKLEFAKPFRQYLQQKLDPSSSVTIVSSGEEHTRLYSALATFCFEGKNYKGIGRSSKKVDADKESCLDLINQIPELPISVPKVFLS